MKRLGIQTKLTWKRRGKDGSLVSTVCYSCRGLEFESQHLHQVASFL